MFTATPLVGYEVERQVEDKQRVRSQLLEGSMKKQECDQRDFAFLSPHQHQERHRSALGAVQQGQGALGWEWKELGSGLTQPPHASVTQMTHVTFLSLFSHLWYKMWHVAQIPPTQSNCGSQTTSMSVPWQLIREAESQANLRFYWNRYCILVGSLSCVILSFWRSTVDQVGGSQTQMSIWSFFFFF